MNRQVFANRLGIRTAVFLLLALLGMVWGMGTAVAQQPVTPLYNQVFDSIGTSQTATVPSNWRVDRPSTVRSVGTWASALTATTQRGGNNLSTSAANGIYNFGAGDAATATDRAIGWLSSSGGTQSGNLYLHMTNNTGFALTRIAISYDIEKYRQGSNANGFRVQLYYSTDGSSWTDAGTTFQTSFGADANNNGYASAPGVVVPANGVLNFATPINPSQDFYLAWNYSVASGTTTTNAQALAVDNVVIGIVPTYYTVSADGNLSDWDAAAHKLGNKNGVDYYLTWDDTYLYVAVYGGNANNDGDRFNVAVDVDPDDTDSANSGTTSSFGGVTFGADGKPDYLLQRNSQGQILKRVGTSGSWQEWSSANSTIASDGSNPGTTEFRFSWSDMGLTDRNVPVGVYIWQSNLNDWLWGSFPPTNLGWVGESTQPLTTRIYLPTTDAGRIPRTYAQQWGDQTQFDADGSFSLLNGFAQIEITIGGGSGCSFKVAVRGNAPADTDDSAVRRRYIIEPSGCTPTVNMTLQYVDGNYDAPDERNGYADGGDLELFRWDGSQWVNAGGTANDANNTVTVTGISAFSPWTFDTDPGPTAVTLQSLTAQTNTPGLAWLALLLVAAAALVGWRFAVRK